MCIKKTCGFIPFMDRSVRISLTRIVGLKLELGNSYLNHLEDVNTVEVEPYSSDPPLF